MLRKRWIAGVVAGVLVTSAVVVAPALGAPELARGVRHLTSASATPVGLGTFTPAAADPRLAAIFAHGGLDADDFRFTPAESRRSGRGVTVTVHGRSVRGAAAGPARVSVAAAPSVGLSPIAYSMGASVGWKHVAVAGDVAKVDLQGLPGGRETADLGVSYSLKRFTGRVKAAADRPLADAPALTEQAPSYSLDVGGSYSLTRNLDVTAGVRYRQERDRDRLATAGVGPNQRDSQAVYVGTAFRF